MRERTTKPRVVAIELNQEVFIQKMITLLMTGLFMLLSLSVIACSCRPPAQLTEQEYLDADLVFIGRVDQVTEDQENYRKIIDFTVNDPIKVNDETTTIEIVTGFDSASCGYTFTEGENWYIWARLMENGKYATGLCSRSVHLRLDEDNPGGRAMDRFNEEISLIQKIKAKKGYQRIDQSEGHSEGKLKKGLRHGKWKFYDASGTLVEECKYKKGTKRSCK